MDTNNKRMNLLQDMDRIELELLMSNLEYSKSFLQEEGFNSEEVISFGQQYMKKIKFMSRAVFNKEKDQSLLEMAYAKVKAAIKENADKTTAALILLLKEKTPSVQYRKLENWTDEEIKSVLAEIDLIKLMEELDK